MENKYDVPSMNALNIVIVGKLVWYKNNKSLCDVML